MARPMKNLVFLSPTFQFLMIVFISKERQQKEGRGGEGRRGHEHREGAHKFITLNKSWGGGHTY